MKNKKWVRFVESFILLPILTMSSMPVGPSIGPLAQATIGLVRTPSTISSQKQNIEAPVLLAINQPEDMKALALQAKADAIDAYFGARNMPLHGLGMKMVLEAEKNDIDWRLLPAIAVRESTGGKHDCDKVPNNAFGWGSCKISFQSNEEAIETIARNLGGNNPNTARHYDNKTIQQILRAYNPPYIVPRYAQQVMSIMNAIGEEDTATGVNA